MQIRPDEWRKLFELRDDLDGEDRALLRKLIKYVEHLEQTMRSLKALLIRKEEDQ
jgi:K+/H+ antiporter YhaU regulatory subunit KhtT